MFLNDLCLDVVRLVVRFSVIRRSLALGIALGVFNKILHTTRSS